MNSKFQKATVAIVAVLVFLATFIGTTREQVVVEAKKIVSDSNNINNNYLIGVQTLKNDLDDKNIVILDIRNSDEYNQGHIQGARNVSWNSFIENSLEDGQSNTTNNTTNWTNLLNKKKLTTELQNLGITKTSDVIIYGNSNGDDLGDLGKFSWMFRMVGINSKMLNGGFKNWESQGFATTTNIPTVKKSDIEINNFIQSKTLDKADVRKNISKIKIVELVNDVKENTNTSNSLNSNPSNPNQTVVQGDNVQIKSQQEVSQTDPPITGVIQIKLSELLNPNGTIKPIYQLQDLFTSKGINKDSIILFYNTNKGNLAFLSLILNMAGYNNIDSYNASLGQVVTITENILEELNNNSNNQNSSSNNQNSTSNQNNSLENQGSNTISNINQNSNNTITSNQENSNTTNNNF